MISFMVRAVGTGVLFMGVFGLAINGLTFTTLIVSLIGIFMIAGAGVHGRGH